MQDTRDEVGETLGSPPALVDCTVGGCKVLTVYKTHVPMYGKKKKPKTKTRKWSTGYQPSFPLRSKLL